MKLLAMSFFGGFVAYGIVVSRLNFDGRRDSRLWSFLATLLLCVSLALLGAFLIPASLGRVANTPIAVILEAPLQVSPRYGALYAASYMGLSLGMLGAAHRLLFARTPRGIGE
jgi:hypothetical protein